MSKKTSFIAAALLSALLTACGGGSSSDIDLDEYAGDAPSNQHNVCAVFDQRPGWREAVARSERRWGTPASMLMAIMWRESSFRPRARPLRYDVAGNVIGAASSAYGFSQAIDGTWEWYQADSGNRPADRTDFRDAADFVGWYTAKTVGINRISRGDAYTHYLNYHEGHAGYRRGRWRGKNWLRDAAAAVDRQARRYAEQMRYC